MGEINTNVGSHSINYQSNASGSVTSINNHEEELQQTTQTFTSNAKTEYVDLGKETTSINGTDSNEDKDFLNKVSDFLNNVADDTEKNVHHILGNIPLGKDEKLNAIEKLKSLGVELTLDDISSLKVTGTNDEVYDIKLWNGTEMQFNINTQQIDKIQSDGYTYINDPNVGLKSENTSTSNIYDELRDEYKQYGGNQDSFKENAYQLLENKEIRKILESHFPHATEEDYYLYLLKVCNVGCVYTAEVNAIFKKYQGREQEFKETFGISMYRLNPNGEVVFNYEPLILDWYTYIWNEYYGMSNIEDIYGNIEVIEETASDTPVSGENYTGSTGLNTKNQLVFNDYLQARFNMSATFEQIDDDNHTFNTDELKKYEGKTTIYCSKGYDLYYVDSETKERGDLAMENGEAHAMVVTDITSDGDLVVSSGGRELILDNTKQDWGYITVVDITT